MWTSEDSDAVPFGGVPAEELSGGVVRAGSGTKAEGDPSRGALHDERPIGGVVKGGYGSDSGGGAVRGGQNHERRSRRARAAGGEQKEGAARARTLSLKEVYRLVRPLFAR